MEQYSFCISGVLVAIGAVVAFVLSKRRPTLYEMVKAEAGDPAQMPKEEWREKAQKHQRAFSRKVWMFFGVWTLIVLVGVGAWRAGPSIVSAFSPTATPTFTPPPTFTPRPSATHTPTYWPAETVNASFTPKGTQPATSPPQVVVTTIYQNVPVTVVVVVTRLFPYPVTVVVTATFIPTGTISPTFTPSPTPTASETPSPTYTPSPTPTHTETPTP